MLEPGASILLRSFPDREGVGVELDEREVVPNGERGEVWSDAGRPSGRVGSWSSFELRSSNSWEDAEKDRKKG